ncbi:unnamed protein product [Gordionus sp. m RMFG-2023]
MDLNIAIILFGVLLILICLIKRKFLADDKKSKGVENIVKQHLIKENEYSGITNDSKPDFESKNIECKDIDENDPEYLNFKENMYQKFGAKNLEKLDMSQGNVLKNRAVKLKSPKI